VVAQMSECRIRECFFCPEVVFGGVGKSFPLESESELGRDPFEYRNRRVYHFGTNAITCQDRYAIISPLVRAGHSNPVGRPQLTQYFHPTSTSLPHAGQRNSPDGGWPQPGQKFTFRAEGSVLPQ